MQNTILRLQDSDGLGIYNGTYWSGRVEMRSSNGKHPAPHDDSKLFSENPDLFEKNCAYPRFDAIDYIFGFCTKEQLRNWIYKDEWLKELHISGYTLYIYQGDVRTGHTQAVINKTTMQLVEHHNILEYFQIN